jgi:TPR repeat protein
MVRENRIEEYRQRADRGDTDALYLLAWEYYRGELVPKDVGAAIALFRQLEETQPLLARFSIAKIKYAEGDNSLVDDIRADCAAGFGPSLYLMGSYSLKKVGGKNGLASAIGYYSAAAQNGHWPSEFQVWRLSKLGLRRRLATAIPAFRALQRVLAARWRNESQDHHTLI